MLISYELWNIEGSLTDVQKPRDRLSHFVDLRSVYHFNDKSSDCSEILILFSMYPLIWNYSSYSMSFSFEKIAANMNVRFFDNNYSIVRYKWNR